MRMTIQEAIRKYGLGIDDELRDAISLAITDIYEKAELENAPTHYALKADLTDEQIQELKNMLSGAGSIMVASADPPSVEIVPRWIPVAERLPNVGCDVLFICDSKSYGVGKYSDTYRTFFCGQYPVNGVTHWTPLPEPPKEG